MNSGKKVLAIDLGASGGRGILAAFDGKTIVMEEIHRFEHNYSLLGSRAYWNLPGIFEHIKTAIANCGEQAVSVGIDTWGVDFGLLDARGELLGLPRSYRDSAFSRRNMEEFGEMVGGCAGLHRRTGIACHEYNTLFQLWALRKEGGLERGTQALMFPNLLEYLLCGQRHSEYSAISTSQLYSMHQHGFDSELLGKLGLPENFFPEVDSAGMPLGSLKADIAAQTGNQLQVISVHGHDTANAALAIPAELEQYTFLSSGTWSLLGMVTSTPVELGGGCVQRRHWPGCLPADHQHSRNVAVAGVQATMDSGREAVQLCPDGTNGAAGRGRVHPCHKTGGLWPGGELSGQDSGILRRDRTAGS